MIKHRKVRFALTVLGIVIGIAAVVGLVSIGQGMETSITEAFESFGADKIIVFPGEFSGPQTGSYSISLEDDDVDEILKVSGVRDAAGMWVLSYPIKFKDETQTVYLFGMDPDKIEDIFEGIQSFELEDGKFLERGDNYEAVLGSLTAHSTFDKDIEVGDKIEIKDTKFKVKGVIQSTGSPQDDRSAMLLLTTMREMFDNGNEISMIMAVADESRIEKISKDVEEVLEDKYGEDTISVTTSEQLASQIGDIFAILSLVLGAIASISLLVAGVGIANTMYMSVLERTREVGIMKAIGATTWNVLEIFLIESVVIGAIGGLIGSIVGVAFSYGINIISQGYLPIPLKASVSPLLFLAGVLFSIIISVLFGLIPARKAAKLNPTDALRYE